MGCSVSPNCEIAPSSMSFTRAASDAVPTVQYGSIPSKQSTIWERQTFPAGMANYVMSVSHFSFGFPAWKSLFPAFGTESEICP